MSSSWLSLYEFTSLFFILSCITVGLINVTPVLYFGATLHLASLQWLVYIVEYKFGSWYSYGHNEHTELFQHHKHHFIMSNTCFPFTFI